jgi:hypothetical protein
MKRRYRNVSRDGWGVVVGRREDHGGARNMQLMEQRPRIIRVLRKWENLMTSTANSHRAWATGFYVFIVLALVMDKTIALAYYFCEGRIKFHGHSPRAEKKQLNTLRRLIETELFERSKEVFHCWYQTRKGGNKIFNPIRDGRAAWGSEQVDKWTMRLIEKMQWLAKDFCKCPLKSQTFITVDLIFRRSRNPNM